MSKRKDGRETGAPLAQGNPRRMSDARCAWRGMTAEQRDEFLTWVLDTEEAKGRDTGMGDVYSDVRDEVGEDDGIGHARLTPQEAYDHDHPPMADDPMAFER